MIDNYKAYRNKVLQEDHVVTVTANCPFGFAPLQVQGPTLGDICGCAPIKKEKKEGNNPMDDKICYLESRMYNVNDKLYNGLRRQFYIDNDPAPETADEYVARIKAGLFTLKDGHDKNSYRPADYIVWRDPSKTADKVGFKVAEEALDKQFTAVKDAIRIKDPVDGLAALQAFETWTYTPATQAA